MTHLRSILRPLAVALCLSFAAAPAVAFAGEGRAPHGAKAEGSKKERPTFPIAADKFQARVEKRLEKARARMEARMKERNVPEDKRAARRKTFDDGAAAVRAAVKRVGQDGTVTKEEAKEVRKLAKQLRKGAHDKKKAGRHGKKRGNGKA